MKFLIYELLPIIINMSLTASVIIVAVLVFRVLLKKVPKIYSYTIWAVVLVRLLCPYTIESDLSFMGMLNAPTNDNGLIEYVPQNIVDNPSQIKQIPIVNQIINNNIVNELQPIVSNPLDKFIFAGAIFWASGMIVIVLYSVIQLIKVKKDLVTKLRVKDNIYIVDYIQTPFVMGLFKPKIYLPSTLSNDEQEYIIMHELCHIKRLDHITRIMAFIALTIHWFNPLVWIAFFLSRKDMEMACDETVMKNIEDDIRVEYSTSLLKFTTGKKLNFVTPLAFGECDTKSRIKNIMTYKKPLIWVGIIATIAVICLAVGLISNPKITKDITNVGNDENQTNLEMLWGNRTDYVGDNSAVGNIIYNLSFPSNVICDGFKLVTDIQPYEIIVKLQATNDALNQISENETALNIDNQQFEINAKLMFSLIGNVDKITFDISKDDGQKLNMSYDRTNYDDVFEKTKTLLGFKSEALKIMAVTNDQMVILVGDELFYPRANDDPDIIEQIGGPTITINKSTQSLIILMPESYKDLKTAKFGIQCYLDDEQVDGRYIFLDIVDGVAVLDFNASIQHITGEIETKYDYVHISSWINEQIQDTNSFTVIMSDDVQETSSKNNHELQILKDSDNNTIFNLFTGVKYSETGVLYYDYHISTPIIDDITNELNNLTADFSLYIQDNNQSFSEKEINEFKKVIENSNYDKNKNWDIILNSEIKKSLNSDIALTNDANKNNRLIMVNDKLYVDTGKRIAQRSKKVISYAESIKSIVGSNLVPTKNDEANFGDGYAFVNYQIVDEENIEIHTYEEAVGFILVDK